MIDFFVCYLKQVYIMELTSPVRQLQSPKYDRNVSLYRFEQHVLKSSLLDYSENYLPIKGTKFVGPHIATFGVMELYTLSTSKPPSCYCLSDFPTFKTITFRLKIVSIGNIEYALVCVFLISKSVGRNLAISIK